MPIQKCRALKHYTINITHTEYKKRDRSQSFCLLIALIENFTESPEYNNYIRTAIDKAEKILGNNLSIFLRKKDINILNINILNFIPDMAKKHDFIASNKIKKGGILFRKDDRVLDCTFDTCLSEQKKWFLKNCISKLN